MKNKIADPDKWPAGPDRTKYEALSNLVLKGKDVKYQEIKAVTDIRTYRGLGGKNCVFKFFAYLQDTDSTQQLNTSWPFGYAGRPPQIDDRNTIMYMPMHRV